MENIDNTSANTNTNIDNYTVKFYDDLSDPYVAIFAYESWVDYAKMLVIYEWVQNNQIQCPLHYTYKAVVLYDTGLPISIIVWHEYTEDTVWLAFGYTKPDYRNTGCYSKLFNTFKEHVVSLGKYKSIQSGVNGGNEKIIRALKRRGACEINRIFETKL